MMVRYAPHIVKREFNGVSGRVALLPYSVYDGAVERLNWVFDQFDHVVVAWSGGKDSTVLVELATRIAAQKGKLPLRVFWIDQEAEYETTVEMARKMRPSARPGFLLVSGARDC